MPLGGFELLIILAIVLLFFGSSRVPQLGRSLGRSIQEFRQGTKEDSGDEAKLRERREDGELPRRQEARHVEERDQTERHAR